MRPDETYVRLMVISQTLTPEDITSSIGLTCDSSWKTGDYRGKTIIIEKDNGWVIGSGLSTDVQLDDHVEHLLKMLEPFSENFKYISNEHSVLFSCVIYSKEVPALYFTADTISSINALGASLDIDLYYSRGE